MTSETPRSGYSRIRTWRLDVLSFDDRPGGLGQRQVSSHPRSDDRGALAGQIERLAKSPRRLLRASGAQRGQTPDLQHLDGVLRLLGDRSRVLQEAGPISIRLGVVGFARGSAGEIDHPMHQLFTGT